MEGGIKKFWKDIPLPVKLIGGGVILLLARSEIRKITERNKAIREAKLQAELAKIYGPGGPPPGVTPPGGILAPPVAPAGSSLSYPLEQFKSWAGDILSYMDGAGTSEEEISAIFDKIKSNQDFSQLTKAFGTKWISTGLPWPANGGYYTLSSGLRSELSQFYIDEINSKLDANGLTMQI